MSGGGIPMNAFCEDVMALRARLEKAEAERDLYKADAEAIGDRAWNHAITRVINELMNMKQEDARRLADRIRGLRTTSAPPEKP